MLTGAAAAGAAGVAGAIGLQGQSNAAPADAREASTAAARQADVDRESVELTWYGTHAWEIRCGKSVVLTDPWLTRFKTGTFTPEGADPRTKLVIKPEVIDKHLSTA